MILTPQQQAAVAHRGSSLLVAASAGSGKTEVLAQRCVGLIADPAQPVGVHELLVVTFTRAAAAELRVRMTRMLRERAARTAEGRMRAHLRRQAILVDTADIGTIDAWCGRMVRDHFGRLGLDPAFGVFDGEEARLFRAEILAETFAWVYRGDIPETRAARAWIARNQRPSDAFLQDLVGLLNEYREHLIDPDAWFEQQWSATGWTDAVIRRRARAQFAEALREELRLQSDQIARIGISASDAPLAKSYRKALLAWEKSLADAANLKNILTSLQDFAFNARDSASPQIAELRDIWLEKRLQSKWTPEFVEQAIADAPQVARWIRIVIAIERRFHETLIERKRAESRFEFADILRFALHLLSAPDAPDHSRPSAIALEYRRRYAYILVDEMQDTSPIQARLLELVSRTAPHATNRFMVGDVKQSIYGFRCAEPRLFASLARAFEQGESPGRVQPLTDNFRSHADVLDGVNRIFTHLFDEDFGGAAYARDDQLRARREEIANPCLDADPRISFHVIEIEQRRSGSHDAEDRDPLPFERAEREAVLAGEMIRKMIAAGTHIPERSSGGKLELRRLRYGDIAILLRAAERKAGQIAGVLRQMGLPCVTSGRESILNWLEVGDVINVFSVLVNRRQDIPLAAYLRGPIGGLSDADLLVIRRRRRGGDLIDAVIATLREDSVDAGLRERLRRAMSQLERWRRLSRALELPALLRTILHESRLLLVAGALPLGEHRVSAIHGLEKLAADFSASGRSGVAEFLQYLDDLDDEGASPHAPLPGAENAIRIMTIHAAKGLEFPVVILMNAGAQFNFDSARNPMQLDAGLGIGMKFKDVQERRFIENHIHFLIRSKETEKIAEEELRLLYVALTRARERLIVIGHASPGAWDARQAAATEQPLSRIARLSAKSMLDWTLMAIACEQAGAGKTGIFFVETISADDIAPPHASEPPKLATGSPRGARAHRRGGGLAQSLDLLNSPIDLHESAIPSTLSVSAMKQLVVHQGSDSGLNASLSAPALSRPAFLIHGERSGNARLRGSAIHRFLRFADLTRLGSADDIAMQCDEMLVKQILTPAEAAELLPEDLTWFGASETGELLARNADRVHRELPFVFGLPLPGAATPTILRGILDCLLPASDGLVIIDYKTDRIRSDTAWEDRLRIYTFQLRAYAHAAGAILTKPIARAVLVFLSMRRLVEVTPTNLQSSDLEFAFSLANRKRS